MDRLYGNVLTYEVASSGWHAAGRRAPFECVWLDGVDITDTVRPERWPPQYRWDFFERGWRPWTPPGVSPAWWESVAEDDRAHRTPDLGKPWFDQSRRVHRSRGTRR